MWQKANDSQLLQHVQRTAQDYSRVADIVYYNVQNWMSGTPARDWWHLCGDIHRVYWVFTNGGNREHIS